MSKATLGEALFCTVNNSYPFIISHNEHLLCAKMDIQSGTGNPPHARNTWLSQGGLVSLSGWIPITVMTQAQIQAQALETNDFGNDLERIRYRFTLIRLSKSFFYVFKLGRDSVDISVAHFL